MTYQDLEFWAGWDKAVNALNEYGLNFANCLHYLFRPDREYNAFNCGVRRCAELAIAMGEMPLNSTNFLSC